MLPPLQKEIIMGSDNLHARIERLEKHNRRLQHTLVILAIGLLTILVMGAKTGWNDAVFREIKAKKITIVDNKGRQLMHIGTDEKVGTGLRVFNTSGVKMLSLGVSADQRGSGILVADKQGRARLGLGMDEGVPSLAVADENGKKLIALGGDNNGYGLVIMDGNEVERAGMGFKEGNTGVVIYDDSGQSVRGMILESNGKHYSFRIDENGNEMHTQ